MDLLAQFDPPGAGTTLAGPGTALRPRVDRVRAG